MMFNKGRNKVLHQRRNNFVHWLGLALTVCSFAEKVLGILVDNKLNMSQPCALEKKVANNSPGRIQKSIASRLGEVIPLYSGLVRPSGELCLVWGSSVREKHRHTGLSVAEGHKDYKGAGAFFI